MLYILAHSTTTLLSPIITGFSKSVNPLAVAPLAPIGPLTESETLSAYPATDVSTLTALTSPPDTLTENSVDPSLVSLVSIVVLLLYPDPGVFTAMLVIDLLAATC